MTEAYETRQVLDPQGVVVGDRPDLTDKELIEFQRLMLLSREFDRRALALQRQGRLGTYPMLEGQEAAQIGSVMAVRAEDFVYPSYREHGVQIARGIPLEVTLSYWRGLPNAEWDPYRWNTMIVTIPIASQLAHAVGHAYTTAASGTDAVTMTYFGDGATSETDFHSAMNFAGVWRTPTVFFCSNNGYAISVPLEKQTASETIAQKGIAYGIPGVRVDGMDVLAVFAATAEAIERARAGNGPTLIEAVCYRYGAHATADDARLYRPESEEALWRDRDPIDRYRRFLEREGLWSAEHEADVVGEAAAAFEAAISAIEERPLPARDAAIRHSFSRLPRQLIEQLHATQRAAGETETAFSDDEVWEMAPEATPTGPTEPWNMAQSINATLAGAMRRDPSVVVLGEDVGVTGGVFRITEGLHDEFGAERVIDTPLNESGIVGTAIGMAIAGGRPVAEIQFDGFVYPAFDQIVSHLGRIRYRTRGHVSLPVVVRFPNGAGIGAHEHHCDSPEAYFAHAPGLVVVIPSTPTDAKGLLTAALLGDDPVIFLEPKVLYRAGREDVPIEDYVIPLGKARIRRDGTDLTLVTYGGMVPVCLAAADEAESAGWSVEVIDLRTIFPWDTSTVTESVSRTGRALVVQEPQRSGGVAAEVAAHIAEECGYDLVAPVARLAGFDAPWPQFAIERHALIDQNRVMAAIRESMEG